MADTNTPTVPKNSGKELGASGTVIQSGLITSEEYNRNLVGKLALAQYDEMRRSDANVHSALQLVKLPLQSAAWAVHPAKDKDGEVTPEDQEVADFISRELFKRKINFSSFLRESLTMLDFGHSLFEKVHDVCDFNSKTRIGLAKLAPRKQTTVYRWETPEGKAGITQMVVGSEPIGIPREKLAIFTNDKEGDNYEGVSLLRYAYKDWHMKSKLTLVNAVALEKMAVGVPVIKGKPDVTPSADDEAKAEAALSNMRANERSFLKIPASMDVEMLDLKSNATKDVLPTLAFHKRAIYESILATFMDLGGSSGSGSQSLSGDLTSFFMKAEEALADIIAETIQQDIIQPLCDLNFSSLPNGYPELKVTSIADDDIGALATSISSLMNAGAITADPELEDHIRSMLKFPTLPEDLKDLKTKMQLNPPAPITETKDDKPAADKGADTKSVEKKDQKEVDQKADKTQAAVHDLQQARRRLIEVQFLED